MIFIKYVWSDEDDSDTEELVNHINCRIEMKNLHVTNKYKQDPEFFIELFKDGYDVDYDVSKAIEYEIEVDVRDTCDYDENDSALNELAQGWADCNHKWSKWRTEDHTVQALKIDGKWYYECMDDEN